MASRTTHNIGQNAGEITGQAQAKRDEIMNQASHGNNPHSSDQHPTYTSQASNFLHQTGEQVKNMAQGAADAVKNTLGMNNENTPNAPSTNHPNAPSTNHPSNPSAAHRP